MGRLEGGPRSLYFGKFPWGFFTLGKAGKLLRLSVFLNVWSPLPSALGIVNISKAPYSVVGVHLFSGDEVLLAFSCMTPERGDLLCDGPSELPCPLDMGSVQMCFYSILLS